MTETLLALLLLASLAALGLLVALWRRGAAAPDARALEMLVSLERGLERCERLVRDEAARTREENLRQGETARGDQTTFRLELGQALAAARTEQGTALKGLSDSLLKAIADLTGLQRTQLEAFAAQLVSLSDATRERLEGIRSTLDEKQSQLRLAVEQRLQFLQEENARKLDEMRATVNERLQGALEQRLGESFKIVSERLEQVHRGLGEMQSLASGVGDLKKVLANVKTRGGWGEVQLGALLEQILAPGQFERNFAPRPDSSARVEFAVRLPGRGPDDAPVWLPIDAKFPQEDYLRLVECSERADAPAVEAAVAQLETRIIASARDIREKYVHPPRTTDFALLFLPTEGLYAEVLRRSGLSERLQREMRVVVVGPTTLAALLNSLQLGFHSLAIERRSSEVWAVLGAVKSEFGRFGEVLERVHKKLLEAGSAVDQAGQRTRVIERKLREVALPEGASSLRPSTTEGQAELPLGDAP